MAKVPHMREVWQWRKMILSGATAQGISERTGYPKSTIYKYTKAERARVKEQAV